MTQSFDVVFCLFLEIFGRQRNGRYFLNFLCFRFRFRVQHRSSVSLFKSWKKSYLPQWIQIRNEV